MEVNPIFPPRILHGQGKRTMTLLTEDGCIYPIIAHDAKNDRGLVTRAHSAPDFRIRRGERPMHRTTFVIAKPPWQPDYMTTSRQFHGGSKHLAPVTQLPPSQSMHHTHFHFGNCGDSDTDVSFRKTDYGQTYVPKDIIPANRLHLTSLLNRINQTEGRDVRDLVQPSTQPASYFTQYRRVHDKLGHFLGPGVERERPVQEQYNVITGKSMGPAWRPHNPRMSGNRVLHSLRRELTAPVLQ